MPFRSATPHLQRTTLMGFSRAAALGMLRAMCYGSNVGGGMTQLILTGTIGGLLGTGLALIGVRQVRILDCVVAFGMLMLGLTWFAA